MGATCGKKRYSGRDQQGKEIALIRFVQRLRYIFNKNKVVPFSEPGSRSVSSVISNTTVIPRNNKNKSRRLSTEERKCQTALNKPCIDQNSTPLLDNVEFNNDDLPSARDKSNRSREIQKKGGETEEAKEKQSIRSMHTCYAEFEKDVDELLSGTNETPNRKRRPKAAKGVRTSMTIMLAANSYMDVRLPGEVIPSSNASNVSRPQLTAPEIHTKGKEYLDSWMERQIKKDKLKK
ncbi:unnamed protein product [Mytilus coruscus]|uniref:Uncharacterized protein n=1 Tax=Mytilus coruscus TaxID=42192 RepID=A0A6J7ZUJ4_MYTCO|nr:unnamed protein product [Mytilus coruscus]